MTIDFQILIGPLKDEETIDWCKGFGGFHWIRETSSRGHGGSPSKRALCVCGKARRRRRRSVRKIGCWFLCVQESSIEGMCVRIKHRKSVCKN
jgi:hypothetical protein